MTSRTKKVRLVDVEPKARHKKWRGSMAVVHVPLTECPACGEAFDETNVAQLPLLRHGGYGAVQDTKTLRCECGWYITRSVAESNPRKVS